MYLCSSRFLCPGLRPARVRSDGYILARRLAEVLLDTGDKDSSWAVRLPSHGRVCLHGLHSSDGISLRLQPWRYASRMYRERTLPSVVEASPSCLPHPTYV